MAQSTINTQVQATVVIAMDKEEIVMKTKNEIRAMLEAVGVEMSNTQFNKTRKTDLVAMLEKYLDSTQKVEIVEEHDPIEDHERNLEAATETLCKMLVGVWVWHSKYKKYNGLHLFYDSKQYPGYKIASNRRLMRITGDVIKELFGDKHNNYNTIHEAYIRMAQYGFCSIREKDFTVFINDKQWRKLENQFNALRTNAADAGCHTIKEYILG